MNDNAIYVLVGVAAVAAIGAVLMQRRGGVPASAAISPAPIAASPGVPAPGINALAPNVFPMNRRGYQTASASPPAPSNSFIPNAGYSGSLQGGVGGPNSDGSG